MPRRIVYCFPLINGYMAACWRAAAARSDINLFVLGHRPARNDLVAYHDNIMDGVPCRLLNQMERDNTALVASIVESQKPDILIISGWSEPAYRALYFNRALSHVPKVIVVDNQFRGTLRQIAGRVAYAHLFSRISCYWAVGERAWHLGRFFGFPDGRLRSGAIGIDAGSLALALNSRERLAGWPTQFLFLGRYHPRKALDVLGRAYSMYRAEQSSPWPLALAGMGPEIAHMAAIDGVKDLGFLSPTETLTALTGAGVFILPSRYDAWPVALVEAAGAGLPLIATSECGSTVEVLRHLYNGYLVPAEDARALAEAMRWMHVHKARLPTMGARSRALAEPYDANLWAERLAEIVETFGCRAAN